MVALPLLAVHPVRRAEDLAGHVLLHTATREKNWANWLVRAGTPELRPAAGLRFEHQQFVFQAALDGLGVVLMPLRR